VYKYINIKIYI